MGVSWLVVFFAWCRGLGILAILPVALTTAVSTAMMLPTFPLMLTSGALFGIEYGVYLGTTVGTLAVFIGMWCGSIIAFVLGRYLFRQSVQQALRNYPQARVINQIIAQQGTGAVFLMRLNPALPAELFSYMCALTPLTLTQFGLGTLGALLPTALWVTGGAMAARSV